MRLDTTKISDSSQNLSEKLAARIVGQGEAVQAAIAVHQMWEAGLSRPEHPVATFLFLGPTGTGKTLVAETFTEALAGTREALIKINCGEYTHGHEVSKLTGTVPGYLGFREAVPLLNHKRLTQYHTANMKLSFVLFDELDKAHWELWNLLMGILDKAQLTLGDNSSVDFSRTVIFLTSNVGASQIEDMLNPRFSICASPERAVASDSQLANSAMNAARRKFPPEFVNRMDKVVVFKRLTDEQLRKILDIELACIQDRIIASGANFLLVCTQTAKDELVRKGTDVRYGARPLKRALEQFLVGPLSRVMATGQITNGDRVTVDVEDGKLVFDREFELASVA